MLEIKLGRLRSHFYSSGHNQLYKVKINKITFKDRYIAGIIKMNNY